MVVVAVEYCYCHLCLAVVVEIGVEVILAVVETLVVSEEEVAAVAVLVEAGSLVITNQFIFIFRKRTIILNYCR